MVCGDLGANWQRIYGGQASLRHRKILAQRRADDYCKFKFRYHRWPILGTAAPDTQTSKNFLAILHLQLSQNQLVLGQKQWQQGRAEASLMNLSDSLSKANKKVIS